MSRYASEGCVSGYGLGESSGRVGYEYSGKVCHATLSLPTHTRFHTFLSLLITYITVTRMFQVFVGHGAIRDEKRLIRNCRN